MLLVIAQQFAEIGDAACRQGLDRAGGQAVDADALGPEAGRHVAHVGFEAGLG